MNTFVTIEEFVRYSNVVFYTIHFEGKRTSETELFFDAFEHDQEYQDDFEEITSRIKDMGEERRGAQKHYFRFEKAAHALPGKTIRGNRLRLYCLRISDEIVILGNGGVKTARTAQACPNVRPHFNVINRFAKAFDAHLIEGEVSVEGMELKGNLEIEI